MIAVLDNQMIGVSVIILCEILYASADLGTGHVSRTDTHGAPEDEARAAFGFDLEDSAGWVFVSSKAILHAMHCQMKCNVRSSSLLQLTIVSTWVGRYPIVHQEKKRTPNKE